MGMMSVLTILLYIGLLSSSMVSSTRYTGETEECTKAKAEFEVCKNRAYQDFTKAFLKGDDKKKPDWLARKSCNYLTESSETCGQSLVGVCYSQVEVNKQKDEQLKDALAQVKENIPSWNTDKCPAMKAHLDRLTAPKAAATSVTASLLSLLVMSLVI